MSNLAFIETMSIYSQIFSIEPISKYQEYPS